MLAQKSNKVAFNDFEQQVEETYSKKQDFILFSGKT